MRQITMYTLDEKMPEFEKDIIFVTKTRKTHKIHGGVFSRGLFISNLYYQDGIFMRQLRFYEKEIKEWGYVSEYACKI